MDWRITEPRHLLGAVRLSLHQGGRFLTSRIAPLGPILSLPNVSYIHKTTWGMYASGVDHATIARLLDWVQREALQRNGDFFFPDEPPEYKDFQRVYRPLNFVKVAAWIEHPLARNKQVIEPPFSKKRHRVNLNAVMGIGRKTACPSAPCARS